MLFMSLSQGDVGPPGRPGYKGESGKAVSQPCPQQLGEAQELGLIS